MSDAKLDAILTTLDVMKGQFARIDQRFDAIDRRFDGINQRFEGIDRRFDGIDRRFDGINQRFEGIDQRLGGIDGQLVGINGQLDFLATRVINVESRLDTFATKDELKKVEGRIITAIDRIVKHTNDFDIELAALRGGYQRHEERLDRLEKPA